MNPIFIWSLVAAGCTLAVIVLCRRTPLIEEPVDRIDEINECVEAGRHHVKRRNYHGERAEYHDAQVAYHLDRVVDLHGYHPDSPEANVLRSVINNKEDYAKAMDRIMRRRFPVREIN